MINHIFSKKPLDGQIEAKLSKIIDNNQLVFSVGGDGTFLRCVHEYINELDTLKFVGINTGHLGFYTEYKVEEIDKLIDTLNKKDYQLIKYSMLDVEISDTNGIQRGKVLNEVVIADPIHTIIVDVYINDKFFETFRGTGLLVSTPSGSTAYNKSLGGSVIDPSLEIIQLSEIAAINNRVYKTLNSSLVLSKENKVRLVIKNNPHIVNNKTYVTLDGIPYEETNIYEVTISFSQSKVTSITNNENDIYDKIIKSFIK